MSDLQNKYRPVCLNEVIGQEPTVRVLERYFKNENLPHALLFSGPAGVGKTSLARVIAKQYLGLSTLRILEIDAATYAKAEDMRELVKPLIYKSISGDAKFIVVDECQALSKQAWQVLLKPVEEPPEHVYFVFCTTEISKVPKTIKTRCTAFTLREVSKDIITDWLIEIAEVEGFRLPDKVVATIAMESGNSPRQALVNLSMCSGCSTTQEVLEVLENAESTKGAIDLCRALVKRQADPQKQWNECLRIIRELDTDNYEGVRIVVNAYIAKVLLNSKGGFTEKEEWLLFVLDAFSKPYNPSNKQASLLLSIGFLLLE